MDQIEIRPMPHIWEHAFAVWRVDGVMPDYVVTATLVGAHFADFVVHRVLAEDWTDETPTYETVREFDGRIGSNRCSNWSPTGLHACSREELLIIGQTMAACWDAASRILSATWSAE